MTDTVSNEHSRPDGVHSGVLEDWGKLISFRPNLVPRPTSTDELRVMLERLHRGEFRSDRVRVPGSLHSCSEIVVADALSVSRSPKA